MKKSLLGKLIIAYALVTSAASHAASVYIQGECGSGAASCGFMETLQQNGPSATLQEWSADTYYDFDIAYVGDELVITAETPHY